MLTVHSLSLNFWIIAFFNSKLYLFQFFFTSYPQYNKSYFLVSFDFLTFVFCNLWLFFLNFSSRHSLNIINQISLYLNSVRLLWLSRGNKGYYSDRGNKNFVIPRGEALAFSITFLFLFRNIIFCRLFFHFLPAVFSWFFICFLWLRQVCRITNLDLTILDNNLPR